jgi:hypothetical protein
MDKKIVIPLIAAAGFGLTNEALHHLHHEENSSVIVLHQPFKMNPYSPDNHQEAQDTRPASESIKVFSTSSASTVTFSPKRL